MLSNMLSVESASQVSHRYRRLQIVKKTEFAESEWTKISHKRPLEDNFTSFFKAKIILCQRNTPGKASIQEGDLKNLHRRKILSLQWRNFISLWAPFQLYVHAFLGSYGNKDTPLHQRSDAIRHPKVGLCNNSETLEVIAFRGLNNYHKSNTKKLHR